jgi:DNA replication protein DnaC
LTRLELTFQSRPFSRSYTEQEAEKLENERKALFAASRCPARHIVPPSAPSCPGWDDAFAWIAKKLGTGFLVALIGPRGTGKTQLAVELVRRVSHQQKTARYLKAIEIFVRIKGTYHPKSDELEKDAIAAFLQPSLLVLDEMSERGESQWEERMLRHIVDKRYDAQKDTLLIGNFTTETLSRSIGDSMSSRLQETGGVLNCNWRSFRGRP